MVAKGDDFIMPHHGQALHDAYSGDKNIVTVEGDHNSDRPQFFLDSVAIFFYNTFQCKNLPKLDESNLHDSEDLMRLDKVMEDTRKYHLKVATLQKLEEAKEDEEFMDAVAESIDSDIELRQKEMAINKFFS